ncbi:SUN-like methylase [Cryptosporidium canis]|uniref:NOL1/NOP2/Sun domain family member 4 n=1 Tax=Cryptosporidium canis TaxID=195482 RepID=A0A9D5HXB5_9CRYT|nr:SUN-like methylase [Cryptosporidium canis]
MLISNLSGKFGWVAYHEQIFTKERLHNTLIPALSAYPHHIAVINHDKNDADLVEINGKIYRRWIFPFAYQLTGESRSKLKDNDILTIHEKRVYFMDAASIIVGYLLRIDRFSNVLDLCSAPGGKALIIIRRMLDDIYICGGYDQTCSIICNEFDRNRFSRLNRVLQDHIGSSDLNRVNAATISGDASHPSFPQSLRRKSKFSKILVDAPCSSDRHLILSNNLSQWSMKLAKKNSKRQTEIIKNAISLLENEGVILYCTCTLNEVENDHTVERICNATGINATNCFNSMIRILKEFNDTNSQIKVVLKPIRNDVMKAGLDTMFNENLILNNEENNRHVIFFEYTKFGSYILPDSNYGAGPLYVAFIENNK